MKITINQLRKIIKEVVSTPRKKPAHELAWEREFTLFAEEEAREEFPEAFSPKSDFEDEHVASTSVYFTWEMI